MRAAKMASLVVAFGMAGVIGGCGGGSDGTPTITVRPKTVSGGGPKTQNKTNGQPNDKTPQGNGTFTGTIKYNGPATSPGIPMNFNASDPKADKFCVANKDKIKDRSLLVGAKGGLANVVIYLVEPPDKYTLKVPEEARKFANKGCMFSPRMMAVVVGRTVRILNEDQTAHNTHIFPKNIENDAFSQLLSIGKNKDFTYNAPETVPLKVTCDIHGWMQAYHLPLDHHFFAVTDEKGEFEIKGLPAGMHTFKAWHEKAGLLERNWTVEIKKDETTTENKTYEPAKFLSFAGPRSRTVVVSLSK